MKHALLFFSLLSFFSCLAQDHQSNHNEKWHSKIPTIVRFDSLLDVAKNQNNGLRGKSDINLAQMGLDSIEMEDQQGMHTVYTYEYDNYGNVNKEETFIRNMQTGQLTPAGKSYYAYNLNGQQLLRELYSWKESLGTYEGAIKELRTYNSNLQLVTDETMYWDDVTNAWEPRELISYSYTSNGDVDTILISRWDETNNSYFFDRRSVFIFDAAGKNSLALWSVYSIGPNIWENEYKVENQYNSANQNIENASYAWDSDSINWVKQEKITREYDFLGSIKIRTEYWGNTSTNDWKPFLKTEYDRTSTTGLLTIINSLWNSVSTTWEYETKEEWGRDQYGNYIYTADYIFIRADNDWRQENEMVRTYDQNQNILSHIEKEFYLPSDQLEFKIKYLHAYNGNNQETDLEQWIYDLVNQEWKRNYKDHNTYDTNGNLVEYTSLSGNQSNTDWEYRQMITRTFDNNQNIIESVTSYYDTLWSGNWRPNSRFVYSYDLNYSLSDVMAPRNYKFTGKLDFYTWEKYDTASLTWNFIYKYTYHYTPYNINSTDEVIDQTVNIYPNPFTDQLVLQWGEPGQKGQLQVFDISGRLVKSIQAISGEVVTVSDLDSGTYIYRLAFGNETHSGKLVKN